MSATQARTARTPHFCSYCQLHADPDDTPVIPAGHRYLVHVGFPGEEGVNGARPLRVRECAGCAIGRDDFTAVSHGICGSYCCGTQPCARPFEKGAPGHDCACRHCITSTHTRSEP